jgi:beta-lactamase regulating signal transducer with metallopeptidase domain
MYNISQVIGVAIIHSMWQGLVIFLFLRLVMLSFFTLSAKSKHNLGMFALFALTTWFIYTLVDEIRVYQWVEIKIHNSAGVLPAIINMPLHLSHTTSYSSRYYYTIESFLPYITIIYIAGILFNGTKLILSRRKLDIIKQTVSIDIAMLRKMVEFAEKLDIERRVSFGLSTLVDVPCVFGYVKPFILLPASIATSLSTEEIEAIIMHELAHIKRNDYFMNLIQQAMSVLLFFNPFAQLINRIINHERENSCDDIVIESTQKPIVYAHALLKLEQSRHEQWQIALAATGKKYHLLNRIERIMKSKKPIGNTRHILLAFVVLTASITGLAWLNPTIAHGKLSFNKIKPGIISELFTDTVNHKKVVKSSHHRYTSKKNLKAKKEAEDNYVYNDNEDPTLKKYSAEMSKYGEEMSKYYNSDAWKNYQKVLEEDGKKIEAYYNSPEWKKYQDEIEQNSKQIQDFYNSPQWKELQDKQQKLSENFQKNWSETAETKGWGEKMGKLGRDIGHYFSSPEFKQMNEQLEKKYGIPHNRRYWNEDNNKDENYKKYQAELESKLPPQIRQETEEMKVLGQKMSAHWNSPEFKQQSEQMRMMGDSMRRMSDNTSVKEWQNKMRDLGEQMRAYQNNPEMKKLQEDMRIASAQMRAYQNSAEFKRLQENMRIASKKMREYMNSPEFKKHMEEMKNWNFNMNFNMDSDEHIEKPEKPEKPEQPEKPEKPEQPEKPDTTGNQ